MHLTLSVNSNPCSSEILQGDGHSRNLHITHGCTIKFSQCSILFYMYEESSFQFGLLSVIQISLSLSHSTDPVGIIHRSDVPWGRNQQLPVNGNHIALVLLQEFCYSMTKRLVVTDK